MAAYAALVSLMQIIVDIEHHHSPPISIDKQEVRSLTQIVTFLQEFLEAGYSSPFDYGDEADPLEMGIADAAYRAEDVIESHIVDRILPAASKNRDDYQIKCINFYQDLQVVIEEMDVIKKDLMEIVAEKVVVHDQPQRFVSASAASLTSSSTGQKSTMVCSNDVILEIIDQLTSDRKCLQIIPIVGMGGIGKTTLAITVYSNSLIKERFDICAWATISQKYDAREILCQLVSQATKRKMEELSERSEDELGLQLHKYLFGRRFLIVMDDMWSIDAWDKIQRFFPNNENGSRILVTTRLSQLSSQLNNNYSLQMEFLDGVSSWDLFSKTVFGEDNCPHELEKIGKKIVENCRGLPLSIVVVGGILKKMEHTQGFWESIRKNLSSVVNLDNDKHCLRLLKMSYNHLPEYLKPCFLYMGVFEEDAAIRVSTLVKLWVLEGFLKPVKGKSLETVARGFLKDLIDRNLILIDKLGHTGNIKLVRVHDLLRDLCLYESKKDGFYHVAGQCSPRGINSQRRIVIPMNTLKKKVLDDLQSMSYARSVICEYGEVPLCHNLGLLRTLHAYKFPYYTEERYVNSHVNLRHLAVEARDMSSFFSSVNLFWNLHTLIVDCPHVSTGPTMVWEMFELACLHFNPPGSSFTAPTEIWKMSQLRCIEFRGTSSCLPDPPSDVVILENLHTLKSVQNFKCGEEVVKRIPNIKKLDLRYFECEETDHDDYYCLSNIKYLCKLESLSVYSSYVEVVSLRKLTFPHSFKHLNLELKVDFDLEEMLEKISSLPLLQKLKLLGGCFRTGKWEIVKGQFLSLKYLALMFCFGLEQWAVEESSILPCLEHLLLQGFKELEIPCEIGNIPTLHQIELVHCSKSMVMSVKEIIEEQVELQGEQLPFHVRVRLFPLDEGVDEAQEALQSLALPNFEVIVG